MHLLYSQRPNLVQERRYIAYCCEMMDPCVHFLPVAADLSDLAERVSWLQTHPQRQTRWRETRCTSPSAT